MSNPHTGIVYAPDETTQTFINEYITALHEPNALTATHRVRAQYVSKCCRDATLVSYETPPGNLPLYLVRCLKCHNACQVVEAAREEPDAATEEPDEPVDEIDHDSIPGAVVCPHCGYELDEVHTEGQFYTEDGVETWCEECGGEFTCYGSVSWFFTTETGHGETPRREAARARAIEDLKRYQEEQKGRKDD